MKTCLYCGCTPQRACSVKVDEQPTVIRDQVREYYKKVKQSVPRWIGCSWISTTPAVCSNPDCMKKHAEASRR